MGGETMKILKALWQFCSYLFWAQRSHRYHRYIGLPMAHS